MSDFAVVILTRKTAERIANASHITYALLVGAANTLLGLALVAIPLYIYLKTSPNTWWAYAIILAGSTNIFASIITLSLGIVIASLALHRFMWPIVERPLYAMWRFKLLQNRRLLFFSGSTLIAVAVPQSANLLHAAAKLLP
jgi:hypothetical protein